MPIIITSDYPKHGIALKGRMIMKFKELAIGTVFEFNYSGLPLCHGLKRGHWVKTSARKYKHIEDGMKCKVGTINVKVIPVNNQAR